MKPENLKIKSLQGDYTVEFSNTLVELTNAIKTIPNPICLIDKNIKQIYQIELQSALGTIACFEIDPTEEMKTLQGIMQVSNWLQSQNTNKQSTLVAIGGGITQDIAAFSAHIYYRGIKWVFIPTTLLSMGDSCIGAKCGINLNSFKNQVGVFHAPSKVLICSEFINTLKDIDVESGYGEMLRLMLTEKDDDIRYFEGLLENKGLRNNELPNLIRRSLEVKKNVIEVDEHEKDLRRILNYGHSFGHALEALTNHEISHGNAVAWGVDLINFISVRRNLVSQNEYEKIHKMIKKYFSFKIKTKFNARELIQATKRDKKVDGSAINLILFAGAGKLKIIKTEFDQVLEDQISEYLETQNVFYWN